MLSFPASLAHGPPAVRVDKLRVDAPVARCRQRWGRGAVPCAMASRVPDFRRARRYPLPAQVRAPQLHTGAGVENLGGMMQKDLCLFGLVELGCRVWPILPLASTWLKERTNRAKTKKRIGLACYQAPTP